MSTTDSEDLETEIHVVKKATPKPPTEEEVVVASKTEAAAALPVGNNEPAQKSSEINWLEEEEHYGKDSNNKEAAVDKDCIFPFIDLETAGNGHEDWEIFNILCGVSGGSRPRSRGCHTMVSIMEGYPGISN